MSNIQLTKSHYTAGVQCAKRMYLLVHQSESAAAPSDDVQLRFSQGQTVGKMARDRFAEGVLVTASGSAIQSALDQSLNLVKDVNAPAIFEGAFAWENLLVRVDILRNNLDGTWDIIEVKSTTELKDEHLDDIAFQLLVCQKAGVKIRRVFLSHINSDVRFPNLEEFFVDHDLTEAALAHLPYVETKLKVLIAALEHPAPPEQRIGRHCSNPYGCEFKDRCWASVPKGSTLELYNYRKRKPTKFELYHEGPKLIQDLKNEVELTRFQQVQFLASKTDEPIVNEEGLIEFLNQVRYPIYYFDFETIAPAIPSLTGMRPYQRIPVQFSCHIQRAPGAELIHREFLASNHPGVDPRQECIEAMKAVFEEVGTIVAYHDDFERSLIRELAQSFPESSNFLLELESRFWDLEDAFQHHFYHRSFGGSVSIKKVLPFFAPEMKYENLAIKNGGQAQAALVKLFSDELPRGVKEQLRIDLLTYCAQDSMAMVVIHQKLLKRLLESNVKFIRPHREVAHVGI